MEIEQVLHSIDNRLSNLERLIEKPSLAEAVVKSRYSVTELAEMTQSHGLKRYRPYTIRKACLDGRISDAHKGDDGNWEIRRETVLRILDVGIPPERRNDGGS